jgi:hypothetical protein
MQQVVGYLAILSATTCFLTGLVYSFRLTSLPLRNAAPWPYLFFPFLMFTHESNRYSIRMAIFGLAGLALGWLGSNLLNLQIVD